MSSNSAAAGKVQDAFNHGNAIDLVDAFKEVNSQVVDYAPMMGPSPKNVATYQTEDIFKSDILCIK